MALPERIIKTANCLLKQPCTALMINNSIPCMNGYNYIHYLRVRYGIKVLDKKRNNEVLKKYYIPKKEKPKVRRWLASATNTSKPLPNTNNKANRINKSIEDKNDKHS